MPRSVHPVGPAGWALALLLGLSSLLPAAPASTAPPAAAGKPPSADAPPAHRVHGPWVSSVFGGGGYVQNIVFAPSQPGRLYSYIDVGGAYRSDDDGLTWRMIHGALPASEGHYSVRALAPSPADADLLLLAAGDQWAPARGVFRSTDGGATWAPVLTARVFGNENFRWTGTVLAWADARTVFLGSGGEGLFRSDDAGLTWSPVPGLEGVHVTDLEIVGERAWICAASFTPHGASAPLAAGFFRSDDAGRTWRRLHEEGPREIAPRADGALLGLEDDQRVVISHDAGDTWLDHSEGLPLDPSQAGNNTSEHRFQALAAGPGFDLVMSARGTVYRRNHDASAWSRIARETVVEELAGRPWWGRLQPGSWPHFGAAAASLVIDPRERTRWWFTDWYAAYETRDAGRTWTLRADGIEDTVLHTLVADPADPAVVHAAMADNAYARSLDGGAIFDTPKPTSNFKHIAVSSALPARLYAVGDQQAEWRASTVWISVDRGDTWRPSPMQGLPPREQHSINSIVVHPALPYEVHVAVSGPVRPGAGGVYTSRDGGRRFEWRGAGLPEGAEFFRSEIWSVGPELAIDARGVLVCASHARGDVYRLDGERWQRVPAGDAADSGPPASRGKPQDLVSDGVAFYLARREGGLWRGEDGGRRWRRVAPGPASAPAVDRARPGRIAWIADGVVRISGNGGSESRALALPPHGLVSALALAGDRLVAGTRGGGLFWSALNPAAAAPLSARPAASGLLPVAEQAGAVAPELEPGDFAEREATLDRWSRPWVGEGEARLDWTTDSADAAGGSLRLAALDGPAKASTGLVFAGHPHAFRLRFALKFEGTDGARASLVFRSRDASGAQLEWRPLAELIAGPDAAAWRRFDREVAAPLGPEAELVLLLEGEGAVQLDALHADIAPQWFGTPAPASRQLDHAIKSPGTVWIGALQKPAPADAR